MVFARHYLTVSIAYANRVSQAPIVKVSFFLIFFFIFVLLSQPRFMFNNNCMAIKGIYIGQRSFFDGENHVIKR